MGMPIRIDVRDPEVAPEAVDAAFDWLRFVDATFSTYLPDSEINRLNRGELRLDEVHPDVVEVLARCDELHSLTRGFFDARATGDGGSGDRRDPSVHLPGALDPSGLVKGWSVERAGKVLEAHGAANYSVNAGGDIRTRGAALPAPTWRIGIQHPQHGDAVAAVVEANDLAIATSGAYERGDHVIVPHTGLAPEGVLSVTIVGHDLGTADAFATAAFAMGLDGPDWTATLHGYDALTILADGRMLSTPRFPFAADQGAPLRAAGTH
jgi:thiamine biosynthesis lipoprotein